MSNEVAKYSNEPNIKSHSIHNDYEIKWNDKLGSGVSGPVRLCIHKETGQEFALKILLDKEKSRKEVGLHWKCSASDYIVRIVDVFANNMKFPNESIPKARLLVVMEIMKGGELFEYITSNQRFTEREASSLTYQIARAIKHCHSLNIAHRDLKPENLLLLEKARNAENVHLKLGDFGFAKIDNGDLRTPQFTPYYVAPQVLEAQRRQREQRQQSGRLPPGSPYHYDKSCDMWSLGVIIYIMLCGYPPFYSEIPHKPLTQTMQNKIMSGNYEFPASEWSSISLEAKNLIKALLNVDPAERMNVDELLQHKWLQSSQVSELVLPSPQIMLNRIGLEETKMAHSTIVSAMRRKDTSFQLKPMEKASNNLLSKRKVQPNDKGNDNIMNESCVKQASSGGEMAPQLQRLVDLCTMPPPTPSTDNYLLTDTPYVTLVQETLAECHDKPFYKPLLHALEQESWNGQYFTNKVNWHRLGDNVKHIF